jgi:hypothetical protein
MNVSRRKYRFLCLFSLAAAALLVAALACSCQSSIFSSGTDSGDKTDVKLTFKVLGIDSSASSGSSASKSISRLILSTATTLTVSLTPLDSSLSTPAPQTVSITGGEAVSVSFPDVEYGSYTISAVAYDSGGSAQFQQSATLTVTESTAAATLNLLPSFFDTTTITGTSCSLNLTGIASGEMRAYSVPTSMLSPGGTVPAGYYRLYVSMSYSVYSVIALDNSGNLLMVGTTGNSVPTITTYGGTRIVVDTSTVYVGPCSTPAPSYLIFVSSGTMPLSIMLSYNVP